MTTWDRDVVARMVDHTLLKPEATDADVRLLVEEATDLGAYAVCVSPSMIPAVPSALVPSALVPSALVPSALVPSALVPSAVVIAAVVGFPSGKHLSEIKALEAELAVAAGAAEVDMVIDVGAAVAGAIDAVGADVAVVRAAVPNCVLKVIVESAALLDLTDEQTLVEVCRAAADAGAEFVKTSTGFHPAGGASVRAVELMAGAVGPNVGVKASGGIRTAADAIAMLDAGATRLGLSGTRAVLDGLGS